MDYKSSILTILLIIFLTIFAIQDILYEKVSNYFIFSAFLLKIFTNLIFYNVFLILDAIYIPIFIILIYFWLNDFIGGGDLKSLIVLFSFTSPTSAMSILFFFDGMFLDILEFFIFLFFLLVLKKPNFFSKLFEYPFVVDPIAFKKPIVQYFLISHLLSIIF